MMGRAGTNSTVGAMHAGAGLMSYAMSRAMADGVQRAAELRAEDDAHAVGHAFLMQRRRQRRQAALAAGRQRALAMLAEHRRLHG